MALSVAAPVTALALPDYESAGYGVERLSCGIARGLFALEFFSLFISHRSSSTLEAEDALVIFAATARAVHSLM